ncbi:hypothetical protein KC357_g287 [Hortaea werneckii]|nr:hypothetical protein KC357_g287 [Hortaea werneckii]
MGEVAGWAEDRGGIAASPPTVFLTLRPLPDRLGKPTPESARSESLSLGCFSGARLFAVPGLEPGREPGRELGRLKLSEGGMGQPMLLTSLDSVESGGLEASAAVAKDSTVLTLSELWVRLCCRFRSISLNRSGGRNALLVLASPSMQMRRSLCHRSRSCYAVVREGHVPPSSRSSCATTGGCSVGASSYTLAPSVSVDGGLTGLSQSGVSGSLVGRDEMSFSEAMGAGRWCLYAS